MVLGVVSFSLLFGVVYAGMGWMKKRGLSGRGHQIAGMIAAYFISCFMLGFLTLGILKASDRGMFISDEKETYEYGGRIWEVSQDELPLKLEDLTGESYEEYTRENVKRNPCFSGRRAFPRGTAWMRKISGNCRNWSIVW